MEELENTRAQQKTSAPNEDLFCVLPWHNIYIDPAGNCKPCCLIRDFSSWGNIREDSLTEIWNNEKFRSFRKTILSSGPPKDLCTVCVQSDLSKTDSPRKRFNREISHNFSEILSETSSSGNYSKIELKAIDFRPSNLCNFKCRTCSPEFSSTWAKELDSSAKIENRSSVLSFSDEQLLTLEEIYFAGGEPLLMKEHYELLNRLIHLNRLHVRLRYNSNTSVLGFGSNSVTTLWQKFEHIHFSCSVDDFGSRAEYSRSGCNWDEIVQNVATIRQISPHVRVSPNITVSTLNILYLPEILPEFLRLGILDPNNPFDFTFNIVTHPEYFSPFILPLEYQRSTKEKLLHLFANWKQQFPRSSFFLYQSLIDQLGNQEFSKYRREFLKNIASVDAKRNEHFSTIYPELSSILGN